MSSITQTTVTRTTSPSTLQLITDALADYVNQLEIDLSQNPFVEKLQLCNNPNAILELLQEREHAFRTYREEHRTLINHLSPAVHVLHAFSGILGEALSSVSCTIPRSHVRSVTMLMFLTQPLLAYFLPSKSYLRRN
jgi:hypothetical protein